MCRVSESFNTLERRKERVSKERGGGILRIKGRRRRTRTRRVDWRQKKVKGENEGREEQGHTHN